MGTWRRNFRPSNRRPRSAAQTARSASVDVNLNDLALAMRVLDSIDYRYADQPARKRTLTLPASLGPSLSQTGEVFCGSPSTCVHPLARKRRPRRYWFVAILNQVARCQNEALDQIQLPGSEQYKKEHKQKNLGPAFRRGRRGWGLTSHRWAPTCALKRTFLDSAEGRFPLLASRPTPDLRPTGSPTMRLDSSVRF